MLIYNYSSTTGEYISQGTADESPLEPGVFMIPANATTIAPPSTVANEVAVFAAGAWTVEADFRGITYWVGATATTITTIGVTVPGGASLTKPAALTDAENALAALPLNDKFDAAIHVGNINVGAQTTTIAGTNVSSATFDGNLLTVVFTQAWEDDQYDLKTVMSGTNSNTVTLTVNSKTSSGLILDLQETSAVAQDITVAVRVR